MADEARIIPIKSEPAAPVADNAGAGKAAPRKRAPRKTPRPTEQAESPAVEPATRRAPARRSPSKSASPTEPSPEAASAKAPSSKAPTGNAKPRRATARPAERSAADAPPDEVARGENGVAPPEELRDLGKFVVSAGPEVEITPAVPNAVVDEDDPDDSVDLGRDGGEQQAGEQQSGEQQAGEPRRPEDPWERKVASALAFLRRRLTGEYEVDEFGFDPELTSTVAAAPFRPLYEKWFRVEVSGLEHVPDKGAALIVANHSGVIALDGVITALALLDHHPAHRHLRMLGADLVFKTPFLGEFARKTGQTLACQADAERLLTSGELVGVYPEGFKGVGKPFSERYKLQRFGRGGFVSAALKTQAPIIPCSIVGAEEIYPMLGNSALLARLLGLPYFPLTPTFPWLGPLGMVPLPSKWYIEFGEPIETASLADRSDDPMLVFNVADQVRETIQQTLYRLLMDRKSVFS